MLTRRDFIKTSLIAGSTACLTAVNTYPNKSEKDQIRNSPNRARVIIARNNLIRNNRKSLDSSSVYNLLNNALENYYEIHPAKKIWAKLFSRNDVVGIKINCLAGRGISSSIELVDAIVENLLSVGTKKSNIIIWDRSNADLRKAGYKIQTRANMVRCFGNDYSGYTNKLYESRSIGSFLSNILVHQCTAIINVPVLKDHGIVGITNALKNFFGAIHNPNKYHGFTGNPYIADVNLLPEIKNKLRLTIGDVLTAQYEGGPPFMPQWTWYYNGLIISTDMVAMDTIAWDIIEKKRAKKGFPSLKDAGREPIYIKTAGDKEHQLGIADLNKIDTLEI